MRSGGVSNSYVEFFCLTLSKTAVGELFSLSIISGIEKVRMRDWGGGGVSRFPSNLSFLRVPKKFYVLFQKFFGSEKVYG